MSSTGPPPDPSGADRPGQSPSRPERPGAAYLIVVALVALGALFGAWIALVGQLDVQDNVAGLIAAAVGVVAVGLVSVGGRAIPQFRPADARSLLMLGPQLCSQTIGVYIATWHRVRGRGRGGGLRTMATDVTGGGWSGARRAAVMAGLLSFTPDTIVVDIDTTTGIATVHDFVARPGRHHQ